MPLILAAPYFKRIAIVEALYAVFDAASKGPNVILSEDNLTITTEDSTTKGARSTVGVTTGRYYFEVKVLPGGNTENICIGLGVEGSHITFFTPKSVMYTDRIYTGSVSSGNIVAVKAGDILGVAFDRDRSHVQFFLNGVNRGTAIFPTLAATDKIYAYIGDRNSATFSKAVANFGQSPFAFPVPSGFTPGLPVPVALKYAIFTPELKREKDVLLSDLKVKTSGDAKGCIRANVGKSTGRWYWEVTLDSTDAPMIGLGIEAVAQAAMPFLAPGSMYFYYYSSTYDVRKDGSVFMNAVRRQMNVGDVVGVALNADTMQVEFFVNGVSVHSSILTSAIGKKVYPILSDGGAGGSAGLTANFGQTAFKYAAPNGFNSGLYA